MFFSTRRGLFGISMLGGLLMGIIAVVIVAGAVNMFGSALFSSSEGPQTKDFNTFRDVENELRDMYATGETFTSVPAFHSDTTVLIALSHNQQTRSTSCLGPEFNKPLDQCSSGACLCLCSLINDGKACDPEETICTEFVGQPLDFSDSCNTLLGGDIQTIRITQEDGLFTLRIV